MAIQLQNKCKADFNSASMSDLVFLLLIFFMIISTQVAPNAINLLLPKSSAGKQLASRNIEVYIDADTNYYVNPQGPKDLPVEFDLLLPTLQKLAATDDAEQRCIVLRADKTVAVEHVVKLMDILNVLNEEFDDNNKYKIVMAVEPD